MVTSFRPSSLSEALEIRAAHTVVPYAGGTDLMVEAKKDRRYLFLGNIPELKGISESDGVLRIGAATRFSDVIESGLCPDILREACSRIGGPAIRNMGTVGGNICNGSPKADSALIFYVLNAELRLNSIKGERALPISEFYLGRNKTALNADELLSEIIIKNPGCTNYYYKKIGARNALAISRVSMAGIINIHDGVITELRTAFGAIGDVIFGRPDLDAMLAGKTIDGAGKIKPAYLAAYDKAINPIRGRVSAEFRKAACMNLLRDFLESNSI